MIIKSRNVLSGQCCLIIILILFSVFFNTCKTRNKDDYLHLVNVDWLEVVLLESFPLQAVVVIKGQLPNPCCIIIDEKTTTNKEGNQFIINVYYENRSETEGMICPQVLVPYEKNIPLDIYKLKAGTYQVIVNNKKTEFELAVDNIP